MSAVLILGLSFLCAITHLALHVSGSTTEGFSADLIHRDSPESPFYDPTSTPSSRLRAAFHRSATRAFYFHHGRSPNSTSRPRPGIWSPVTNDNFEFLMTFRIGSNGQEVIAIVDTGSSLIWVLCYRCPECFEHDHAVFYPLTSRSYQKIQCNNAPPCSLLDEWSCDDKDRCKYYHDYVDGSFVRGILSTDRLTFEQNVHVDNIFFGCTHETQGSFNKKSIGIVGLGNGELSLVRQLKSTYGSKFSYCLSFMTKQHTRGKINFGSAANIPGHSRTVTTTLFIGDYYYSLKLETISVEGAKNNPIKVKPNPIHKHGNMIIDTGIRHTYIDKDAMDKLINVLVKLIELPKKDIGPTIPPKNHPHPPPITPINQYPPPIPKVGLEDEVAYNLCFNKKDAPKNIHLPAITLNFADGAKVIMDKKRAYINLDENSMICLNILSGSDDDDDGMSIFGTYSQSGFLIGYDLNAEKLTLVPNYC